jgi:phosphomevalonate kinase
VNEDQEKRSRNKPWYRRASSADKQQKKSASLDSNENDEDQSAIWHHVFREVDSEYVKNDERSETSYKNYFNNDDDYYYDDEDYTKDGMELELLQPTADAAGKARPLGSTAVIPNSETSTSVVMETASIGGGRMTTRTRLHKYQQHFSFCAGDRRLSVSA